MAVALPPLPSASVPVVDPQTGRMTPDWYRFFVALLAYLATP